MFEDEKGWKGSQPDHRRLLVPVEDLNYSNFQLDNNRHNSFNLYLAIYRGGVLTHHFFAEPYNEKFYASVLLPKLSKALKDKKDEEGFEAKVCHHDNCLNGKKNSSALDKHLGKGVWTTYTGRPCKIKVGVRRTECYHRKGPKVGQLKCVQNRPIYQPKDPCECNFEKATTRATATQAPANCPHLNITELAFNQLLYIVKRNHRDKSFPYGPGAALKKLAVEKAIQELDEDKEWFQEAYKFLPNRWKVVVEAKGYVPSTVKGVAWGSRIWRQREKGSKKRKRG